MIEFKKPELEDRLWIIDRIREGTTDGCCFSFGSLFTWCNAYDVEVADKDGLLLIRGHDGQGKYYVYPSGKGDIKAAILEMAEDAKRNGWLFKLEQLLDLNKADICQMFPDEFRFIYDRDSSEYVYSISNMADLPGKKFHGKKGHVNAFFRNHSDVRCDPITEDNIHECIAIEDEWLSERSDDYGELANEHKAIELALHNYKALDFMGAILYADGKAVAFTMGEELKNNTFCTHFEKTLPDYKDAYPVINNGFTKLMLMGYDYVNREEDTGSDGLRQAKLSYNPEFLLNKYTAILLNDPCKKYSVTDADIPNLISLWNTVFGDNYNVPEFFINNAVSLNNVYAYREDGKIVSAFYLVDCDIVSENGTQSAVCLYAAATLPEYRGRGIMTELINYAKQICIEYYIDNIILYPAEDSLYDYYGNLGFSGCFKEQIFELRSSDFSTYAGQRYFNTSLNYSKMREFIPAREKIEFFGGYLDYARFCANEYGFEKSVVFDDEDNVYIIGRYNDDGSIVVDEAISSDCNYNHILGVLADMQLSDTVYFKTPVGININDFNFKTVNAGMLYHVANEVEYTNIYMGQPCM